MGSKGIIKEEMKDKDLTFEEIVKITGKEVYFQGTNVSTRQVVTFHMKQHLICL